MPLPGGHRNTVLRVGTHVLKTTRRSEAAIAWLHPITERAATCGLRVPTPHLSNLGTYIVDGWTCEPFHPGTPTPPSRIADAMTRLHTATTDLPQRDGFASAHELLTTPRGGDVDLDTIPPDLVNQCRAAWAALTGTTTLIHADLNPSNILTGPDGTVTLIDWDEARRDLALFDTHTWQDPPDPVAKRAAMAWEIACSWTVEPDHARRLAQLFAD